MTELSRESKQSLLRDLSTDDLKAELELRKKDKKIEYISFKSENQSLSDVTVRHAFNGLVIKTEQATFNLRHGDIMRLVMAMSLVYTDNHGPFSPVNLVWDFQKKYPGKCYHAIASLAAAISGGMCGDLEEDDCSPNSRNAIVDLWDNEESIRYEVQR